jgi:hypothetical protein
MGLDFIYINSFYGKGLRVWAYSLKALGWVGCSAMQGVKKGKGTGIIVPTGIFSSVKGLNLEGSTLFSKRCSSIYCFIWASLSAKSFCS